MDGVGEVKFVSGVWIMFRFTPNHAQPCQRLKLVGWISVAVWNGSTFRLGEFGDGVDDSSLTDDEMELRALARADALMSIAIEFSEMVLEVQQICMPLKAARASEMANLKNQKLVKAFRSRACFRRVVSQNKKFKKYRIYSEANQTTLILDFASKCLAFIFTRC